MNDEDSNLLKVTDIEQTKLEERKNKKYQLISFGILISIALTGSINALQTKTKKHKEDNLPINIESSIVNDYSYTYNTFINNEKKEHTYTYIDTIETSNAFIICLNVTTLHKDNQEYKLVPPGYQLHDDICYKILYKIDAKYKDEEDLDIPYGYIKIGNEAIDVLKIKETLTPDGIYSYEVPEGYNKQGELCYKIIKPKQKILKI